MLTEEIKETEKRSLQARLIEIDNDIDSVYVYNNLSIKIGKKYYVIDEDL
jgi:hypothetical protein